MVLLDLGLPKIPGLDVLKEIRATRELDEMPVVVLTTSKAESDVGEAYKFHANNYLVKPHDFDPKKKYPLILNVHGGPQGMWAGEGPAEGKR